MLSRISRAAVACGLVLTIGCGGGAVTALDSRQSVDRPLDATDANATVKYVPLEGGCWALEIAGARVEPVGLPERFRVDGLRVFAVVRPAPQLATRCMIGPVVTLEVIRAG